MTKELEFDTEAEAEAKALQAEAKWLKDLYQPDDATPAQIDKLRAHFNLEADTERDDVLAVVHAYEKSLMAGLDKQQREGMRLDLYMENAADKRPTSTLQPLELAQRYAMISDYSLDAQGAAQAFKFIHGDLGGDSENKLPIEAFAYDSKASTWRRWDVSTGWHDHPSILEGMTDVVAALCARWAYAYHSDDPTKLRKEYSRLRQRHLSSTVTAAVKLAESQMAVDAWDSNDGMIGLPDAEVLYMVAHKRRNVHTIDQYATDYLTKSMAARPGNTSSLWLDVIRDLTGGDKDYANGLQLWTADAMLPGNSQHKAHILYGDGGTGKSVFLKTIQAALGDYAGSARASVFINEGRDHPAELLPFINKRLVVLPELPQGALRSDLLKVVTGGDAISVRGMHQNPRTETPSATLWFSCNELPSIRMVDNSLRRRLMIWPMDNAPPVIDVDLGAKLQTPEHLGGVVAWLVDGLKSIMSGETLTTPLAVQQATEAYFQEADTLRQWADECTTYEGSTKASDLYHSYVGWCAPVKRHPLSDQSFYKWLARNYELKRKDNGRYYPLTIEVQT